MLYEHFEKPMKSNLVIEKASALSENIKVSSLSQEVVRVLKNCSEGLENELRIQHLDKLSVKMKTSGYNTQYIRKVMMNGVKRYESILRQSQLEKSHKKYRPLHLNKKFNASGRLEKKLLAKSDWFKLRKSESDDGDLKMDGVASTKNGTSRKRKSSGRLEERKEQAKQTAPSTVMFVPWTVRENHIAKLEEN